MPLRPWLTLLLNLNSPVTHLQDVDVQGHVAKPPRSHGNILLVVHVVHDGLAHRLQRLLKLRPLKVLRHEVIFPCCVLLVAGQVAFP